VDFALQQAKSYIEANTDNQIQQAITQNELTLRPHFHVVVIDCGVKCSILNHLRQLDYKISIVPNTISFEEMTELNPDGILLSNGPGNPEDYDELIKLTKKIIAAKIPLFAICLGHQILALASGAKIYKMLFGQHGANHPIYDEMQNKIIISSQNHNFAVSYKHFPNHLKITHRSLVDGSIAGLMCTHAPAFSFQGHPEGGPGPTDCASLFIRFNQLMEKYNAKAH
jgi:carbamoyl-phosphate synthase small subunit